MTDGFSSRDLAKPPSRRELERDDKDFAALAHWYRTQDEGAVAKALRLSGGRKEARVRINRAVEALKSERTDYLERVKLMHEDALMMMMRDLVVQWQEGTRTPEALLKVMERHSKLNALDDAKDAGNVNVGTFVLTGDSAAEIPRGATVIDTRLPDER